ncbi:MAG: hypothetical protein M3306_20095 [Actinomycetota bacterium]|nr:hypothetical protein [Actinomycetota bacterium]
MIGPILLAPAIGSLGGRDLWRLLGRFLRQVPRRVGIAVVQVGVPVVALVASDVTYALHMRDEIDDVPVDVQLPPADSEWQVVQGSLRMMGWAGYDIVEYRAQRAGDVWDVYLSPDSNPGFRRSADSAVDDGTSPAEIAMELEPGAPDELARANCWACPG